jgi:hypothetical protein
MPVAELKKFQLTKLGETVEWATSASRSTVRLDELGVKPKASNPSRISPSFLHREKRSAG